MGVPIGENYCEQNVQRSRQHRHFRAVDHRIGGAGSRDQGDKIFECEGVGQNLRGPTAVFDKRNQQQGEVGQCQSEGRDQRQYACQNATLTAFKRAWWQWHAFLAGRNHRLLAAQIQVQKCDRNHTEHHRLGDRHRHVALQFVIVNFDRQHAIVAGEDKGRTERCHADHKYQNRRRADRRPQLRQNHLPINAPVARAQATGSLNRRAIEPLERCTCEQEKVDIETVGMHDNNSADAAQVKRRGIELENSL